MKALKVIIVLAVLFVFAELAVRIFAPEYRALDHRKGITGGVPFSLNSYGLRDVEFGMEKGDEYRILCVGDSVTFGTQNRLEDTYPKVLERLLNEGSNTRYRVINAGGLGGYPQLEFEYIKAKGIDLMPDHVILGLCLNDVGNGVGCDTDTEQALIKRPNFWKNVTDFSSYRDPFSWNKELPFVTNIAANIRRPLIKLRWYLMGRSYLLGWIDVNITGLLYRTGLKKYSFDMYGEKMVMLSFGIDDAAAAGWKKMETSLIDMKKYLSGRNIGFTVAVFPYEFQVSDNPRENFFRIDKSKFTINPQERMIAFGKENDIAVVDILPEYQKSGKKLYYPLDYCHPNVLGHHIAARTIYGSLIKGERTNGGI
ncbi:MAG: hypothetical protein WC547_00375 [Candidatus Omnitrophota bacterium]